MRNLFILSALFFLAPALLLFGAAEKKVLVYYFKNLSGEQAYEELVHTIPRRLHALMLEKEPGSKAFVIDEGGIELIGKDSSVDLWNISSLMNLANRKGFDEVLYGSFYVFGGKPVLIGKVLYPKSGLVMDVTEMTPGYLEIIRETSNAEASELGANGDAGEAKDYSPPFVRTFGSPVRTKKTVLTAAAGPFFPLGEWGELYPTGVLGDVSFAYFPKISTFPLGLGANGNFSYLGRDADATFAESSIMAFSLGASLQYKLSLNRIRMGVVFDFNTGISVSFLTVDAENATSFDPYLKAGVNLVSQFRSKFDFSLKSGIYSINYKSAPLDSIFVEGGIWID